MRGRLGRGIVLCVLLGACGPGRISSGGVEDTDGSESTGGQQDTDTVTGTDDDTDTGDVTTSTSDGGESGSGELPRFDVPIPDAPLGYDCVQPEFVELCPWEVEQATLVTGSTPMVPLELTRAHFGAIDCGCVRPAMGPIVLLPSDALSPEEGGWEDATHVEVWFDLDDAMSDDQAVARFIHGGLEWEVQGSIQFESVPSPAEWLQLVTNGVPVGVSGMVDVDQDGFVLTGPFEATWCGAATVPVVCEGLAFGG